MSSSVWPERLRSGSLSFERGIARVRRLPLWTWIGIVLLVCVGLELHTSAVQSWVFSSYGAQAFYHDSAGPSPRIAYPAIGGPYDRSQGYALLPRFLTRLEPNGWSITRQARFSPALLRLTRWGLGPIYRGGEPVGTGLVLEGPGGDTLYVAAGGGRTFRRFEDIPELVVKALLFIENQELEQGGARHNPVIEWDRLLKGVLIYGGAKLGIPWRLQGASTLATQIEKYRHSPRGETGSPMDKLRQMIAASFKAYRDGPDTRAERREIIVDYLNSAPLGGISGFGAVAGIGEGLEAWYGLALPDLVRDLGPGVAPAVQARAFKHLLALLCAVRAPSYYLARDPAALTRRVGFFTDRLANAGVIDRSFAREVTGAPLEWPRRSAWTTERTGRAALTKATAAVRDRLVGLLGVPGLYDLDRLHLSVKTTLNDLEPEAERLLRNLQDPAFVAAKGLRGEHLLTTGDPAAVRYAILLYERTARGNELRVHADNLEDPLDLNDDSKLELGSTAKLRTVAHYLELIEDLYRHFSGLDPVSLDEQIATSTDPLTKWAATTLRRQPNLDLSGFLELALDRTYSANPHDVFFTGGGVHTFGNFDPLDNQRILTIREATARSTNLVFIRLMQDLVRYHEARLPYDAATVIADPQNPDRRRLLADIGNEEATEELSRAYPRYRGLTEAEILDRLLGTRATSPRHLAIFFFASHPQAGTDELASWLATRGVDAPENEVDRLARAYGNPALGWSDYGYLLGANPVDLWCAVQLTKDPRASWQMLFDQSQAVRRQTSAWLFRPRNRHAQDLRLRARIERDAFDRMTAYWKRLSFPFDHLVPSLATAIGSSSDRPAALADLMGIVMNDGIREPTRWITELDFADGTPYHTVLAARPAAEQRLLSSAVARALQRLLATVVERGTARRAAFTVVGPDGTPVTIGGKTGSGDNRIEAVSRGGQRIASRPVSRTATFVFYVGKRYFGVITAFVPGEAAEDYGFTSALPVAMFRLLAPALERHFAPASLPDGPPSPVRVVGR